MNMQSDIFEIRQWLGQSDSWLVGLSKKESNDPNYNIYLQEISSRFDIRAILNISNSDFEHIVTTEFYGTTLPWFGIKGKNPLAIFKNEEDATDFADYYVEPRLIMKKITS